MKNILFIAFSSFIFLFVSCTSEQETETYIPIDEIIPLDTHLIPNKDTKIVSIMKKRVILLDSGRILKDYEKGTYVHEGV